MTGGSLAARRASVLATSAVIVVLAGCSGSGPSASTSAPSLPPLERVTGTRVQTPGAPAALLSAFGSLWVMSHRDFVLRRIDPASSEVTASIDTGVLGCGDLVEGAGSVWVTGCEATPHLVRVDPTSNQLLATAPLDALGPTFHDGQMWIGTRVDDAVVVNRINPDQLDAATAVPVPRLQEVAGIVALADSVWVGDPSAAVVYRLDPGSGDVQAAVSAPVDPGDGYLVEHDSAPWYIDPLQGLLVRVDPATNRAARLQSSVDPPSAYWGIAASTAGGPPGRIWVRSGDDEVWLVDTRRDRVLRRLAVQSGGGGDVQEVDGALWVAGFAADSVERFPL